MTSVDTGPNNEYYPIVSGTGDPGATITITDVTSNSSTTVGSVTVLSNGTFVTGQLTEVTAGTQQSLVVEQSPTSGGATSQTVYATVTQPTNATLTGPTLGSTNGTVTVAGVAGAGIEVLASTAGLVQTDDVQGDVGSPVSVSLLATTAEARYSNGAGRYGAWITAQSSGVL